MSNPKATCNELENNGDGSIKSLNTYQKRAPDIAIVSKETSAVLEDRVDVDSTKSDKSRRTVSEYPPSTSSSFVMPHPQNIISRHDISSGLTPASSSLNFPSATAPSVPVSLIRPANPRTSIESNHRDYIQRLRNMTPEELSKHALELENRSRQIDRAAIREFDRKAALEINLSQQPSNLPNDTKLPSHLDSS